LRCLPAYFFLVSVSAFFISCSDGIDRIPIVEEKCGKCHTTDQVYAKKRSSYEWSRVVHGMKVRGLVLSEKEEKQLMKQLNTKLGSGK